MHLKGAVPVDLCRQVIEDYESFEQFREQQGCTVRDSNARNYRLANFHLESEALLEIAVSSAFHEPVSRFFRRPSTVYTSLTYKHGSQQAAHIDTPYFWTRPFNLFAGVWVALEDVSSTSGPLFYYPGSHRIHPTEAELVAAHHASGGDLQRLFENMRAAAELSTERLELHQLKAGDAVIWHPGILHGGTLATDSSATRYSCVFHFAPLGVNVRDHRVFPRHFHNLPTYGVRRRNGHYYCRGRLPTVMV